MVRHGRFVHVLGVLIIRSLPLWGRIGALKVFQNSHLGFRCFACMNCTRSGAGDIVRITKTNPSSGGGDSAAKAHRSVLCFLDEISSGWLGERGIRDVPVATLRS